MQTSIGSLEKMQIRQELALLEEVEKHKAAVDEELERQGTGPIYGKQALRIIQLPGVGFFVATPAQHSVWCSAGVRQAAWRAVQMSPFSKAEYEKHLQRTRKRN